MRKRLWLAALLLAALTACGGQVTPNPAGSYTPPTTPPPAATVATTGAEAGAAAGAAPGTYNARGNRDPGLNNFVEWRSATAVPLKLAVSKIESRKSCKYGDPGFYLTAEVIVETADDPDQALPLFSLYGDWEAVALDGRSFPAQVAYCGGDPTDWLRTPQPNRKYDHKITLHFAEQPPPSSVLVFTPGGDDHGVEWAI